MFETFQNHQEIIFFLGLEGFFAAPGAVFSLFLDPLGLPIVSLKSGLNTKSEINTIKSFSIYIFSIHRFLSTDRCLYLEFQFGAK